MKIIDLKEGQRIKLGNGTIFIIEEIKNGTVISTMEGGIKRNYSTEINDAVDFFNEEKAIIL